MNRNTLLCLLFAALVATPVFSAEITLSSVFSGEVKDVQQKEIDSKNFTFTVLGIQDKFRTRILFPDKTSQIVNFPDKCVFDDDLSSCTCTTSCECVTGDGYRVCFKGIRRAPDTEFNITAQHYPLYASLEIGKTQESVDLASSFVKTTLREGEETTGTFTFSNTGTKAVIGGVFTIAFPKNITIIDTAGVPVPGNKVEWKGNIGLSSTSSVAVRLRGANRGTSYARGTLSFEGLANKTVDVTFTIEPQPVEMRVNISKTNVRIGEIITLVTELENKHATDTMRSVRYRMIVPAGFKYIAQSGDFDGPDTEPAYMGDLIALQRVTNKLQLQATRTGNFTFKESLNYVSGLPLTLSNEQTLEVEFIPLDLSTGSWRKTANGYALPIFVTNIDQDLAFSSLELKIESDLPMQDIVVSKESISPNQRILIREIFFTPEAAKYTLDASLTYLTPFGESKKASLSLPLDFESDIAEETDAPDESIQNAELENAKGEEGKFNLDMSSFKWGWIAALIPFMLGGIVYIVYRTRKA